MYERIVSIEFFRNYKIWKSFTVWKKLMRRNIFNECSKVIQKKLFILDDILRNCLLNIRELSLTLNKKTFYDETRQNGPVEFNEFKEMIENFRGTNFIKGIQFTEN
jgi:hypothetical protein